MRDAHHVAQHPEAWACPLCGRLVIPTVEVAGLRYASCPVCVLISLDPAQRPLPLAEVMRYAQHQNAEDNTGYRRFLDSLVQPMRARLQAGAFGLDFGCGPAPVLAGMLTEAGCPTMSYDPVFAAKEELLERRYDFVACSEVVEHLHHPAHAFVLFGRLLDAGGLLGVMTRFHRPSVRFETWWYRRDSTHVCFYGEQTMHWIANRHGWTVEIPAPDVALFTIPRLAARGLER